MLFDSWADLGRILATGVLAYVALVFLLRISGKRTLSKMNAFDFVVTVALGSTIAATILSADTSLAEGVLALALLIALQAFITWGSVRSERFQALIKSQPRLLLFRGRFLDDALQQERVTTEEVRAAIRSSGISRVEDVAGVVLETDGTLTVVEEIDPDRTHGAFANVAGADRRFEAGEQRGAVGS